jgi:hypothetical protein
MNRAEALKILRIDAEHDAHAVEQSYWSLVRRAQAQRDEHAALRDIDRLNAAYAALAPQPEPMTVSSTRQMPRTPQVRAVAAGNDGLPEIVLAWVAREFDEVRHRWAGRLLEVGVLFASVTALALLALAAGANWLFALIVWIVAAIVVWSPWRESGGPD